MIGYDELYKEVKNTLSEKRFKHSEGVVERAIEYARIYGVDEYEVKLTAIAHDIAKEIPKDEILKYAEEIGADLDEVEKKNLSLPHAKIGAQFCKLRYDFSNDMVNAIKYHTTGRANMSMLEKIINLADATEPGRTYFDLEYYVDVIKKDIDRGMFEVSKWTIEHLASKEGIIHLDTVKCYNFYKEKLM